MAISKEQMDLEQAEIESRYKFYDRSRKEYMKGKFATEKSFSDTTPRLVFKGVLRYESGKGAGLYAVKVEGYNKYCEFWIRTKWNNNCTENHVCSMVGGEIEVYGQEAIDYVNRAIEHFKEAEELNRRL